MSKVKRKRKRLTVEEKCTAYAMLLSGCSQEEVISVYNVSPSFERKLRKEVQGLPKLCGTPTHVKRRKSSSKGYYPLVEKPMIDFVKYCRELQFPVSNDIIQAQAELVKQKLLLCVDKNEDIRSKLRKFKASYEWWRRFINRNALESKRLYVTAGRAAVEKTAHRMEVLRSRLCQYSLENIYNVDEIALFFKCLPRKTYVLPDENIKS